MRPKMARINNEKDKAQTRHICTCKSKTRMHARDYKITRRRCRVEHDKLDTSRGQHANPSREPSQGCYILADTSIKDWHRAQRKIECWTITRLARRGRRAEEPPRLSSTTHSILEELGRPLITVFMSSCKRVYRRMPVAGHPFCNSCKAMCQPQPNNMQRCAAIV
jgi:hypothetical protein